MFEESVARPIPINRPFGATNRDLSLDSQRFVVPRPLWRQLSWSTPSQNTLYDSDLSPTKPTLLTLFDLLQFLNNVTRRNDLHSGHFA